MKRHALFISFTFIAFLLPFNLTGCKSSRQNTDTSDSSSIGNETTTAGKPGSDRDTAIPDSSVDSSSSPALERIASLPDYDGILSCLDVAHDTLFLCLETHIYKSSLSSTEGFTDVSNRVIQVPADPAHNIVEEDAMYMLQWTAELAKYDFESSQIDYISVPDAFASVAHSVATDGDRFYFTNTGCDKIVSIDRDGTNPLSCEQQREGRSSGHAAITVGEKYVYCSGGTDGSTDGKIYRCPKDSSEPLTHFATITKADAILPYQAGPMREVNGYLYYLCTHPKRASLFHRFSRVDIQTGELEVLATIQDIEGESVGGSPGDRLLYDAQRNSFYWLVNTVSRIAKFTIDDMQLEIVDIRELTGQLAQPTLAQDDDFLYWPTAAPVNVYKLKKF